MLLLHFLFLLPNPSTKATTSMAPSSARRLNPNAPPFVPVTSTPAMLCPPPPAHMPVGFPLLLQCLRPPPSLPLPCGVAVPPLPCVVPPPPPSPRSVLSPSWSRSVSPRTRKPAAAPRPMGSKPPFDPRSAKTSLMICNIPNGFSKRRLMAILDQHCAVEKEKLRRCVGKAVKSEYDFLYVPIDFGTKNNKGYAFVNMTTATAARRLHEFLHGHSWAVAGSNKVCEVVHASIQGANALVKHFSGVKFPCGNENEEFLPVRFGPPRSDRRPTAERVVGQAAVRRARW
ncbi:protein MEI2-like 6 [Hordeum vulgare subsp. vulgare]|uniref:Mei2-like C-terminal RNA recognition motif domain-containing protein n=1 Tax=Hordeum vulgare subsp. vulgare TaxID=112509 RepID=A0A8I6Y4X8_HORVV|nr:protein MEI2-like 6 [Hordeum vulgare subsp. vulgare]